MTRKKRPETDKDLEKNWNRQLVIQWEIQRTVYQCV